MIKYIRSTKFVRLFSLLKRAFGQYKIQVVIMAILSFVSGTLEGVGINAVIPLFSFIGDGKAAARDDISLAIERFFHYFNFTYTVKSLLIFIVILFVAKAVTLFIAQYITAKIIADFERKIRSEVLRLTFSAKWPFLVAQKIGHLDQVLTTDVSNSSAILYYISNAVLVIANLVIYSFLVFNISQTIALLVILFGLVILMLFKPLLYRSKLISGEMVRKNKELAHYANENIIGMKVIKSMHLEDPVSYKGSVFFGDIENLYLKLASLKNFTSSLMQLVGIFFIIGLFAFFYKITVFNFASFAIVVYALNKVFANIQQAQINAQNISQQAPYLMSILDYKEEAMKNQEADGGGSDFRFADNIAFRNVDFYYNKNQPTLSGVSFNLRKGLIMGLIGQSGAGKTTIVDLLLRLLNPDKGEILLDGKNISDISLREWRNNIGYVSQDVFLMNDTIGNNIKFYNDAVSDSDMVKAAKMANIYDFIQDQPDKFSTQVGERGLSLSGGQRQRIALARVLARKPQILILDEATSSLDSESESLIQKSIENMRGEITVIIIAHRLSTVLISDKLIVMENGKVIEEGVPAELLKDKNSYFSRSYNINS